MNLIERNIEMVRDLDSRLSLRNLIVFGLVLTESCKMTGFIKATQ
jgi:hypothetical protein